MFRALRTGVGYMFAPANWGSIRRQWREICVVASSLRVPARRDDGFVVGPDYRIDFEASAAEIRARALIVLTSTPDHREEIAQMTTVTANELRGMARLRQRKTAQMAWTYLAVCAAFTAVWLGGVLGGLSGLVSILYMALWLMAMLCFATLALREMWANWCLRTSRIAPLSAFLSTTDSWLPV